MAEFIENLWNSIFTPGPTPTLLVATNATFLSLQIVLAVLLAATRSIHIVVLSVLSAALWWSINWFASEIQKAKKAEEEAERLRKRRSDEMSPQERETDDAEDEDEDETETETEAESKPSPIMIRGGPAKIRAVMQSAEEAEKDRQAMRAEASGAQTTPGAADATKRSSIAEGGDAASTDSEWEKVSDR